MLWLGGLSAPSQQHSKTLHRFRDPQQCTAKLQLSSMVQSPTQQCNVKSQLSQKAPVAVWSHSPAAWYKAVAALGSPSSPPCPTLHLMFAIFLSPLQMRCAYPDPLWGNCWPHGTICLMKGQIRYGCSAVGVGRWQNSAGVAGHTGCKGPRWEGEIGKRGEWKCPCGHKSRWVANQLNLDHVIMGLLQQPYLGGPFVNFFLQHYRNFKRSERMVINQGYL